MIIKRRQKNFGMLTPFAKTRAAWDAGKHWQAFGRGALGAAKLAGGTALAAGAAATLAPGIGMMAGANKVSEDPD